MPLLTLLLLVVGLEVLLLQHTPRAVTEAPPSLLIVPPLMSEFYVMLDIVVVDNIGNDAEFVRKLCAVP